eukprot:m.107197 g.107197  ORF g.107197 m.107197 type:complete len:223 (+) comp14246_c0_seq1:50-718(+)
MSSAMFEEYEMDLTSMLKDISQALSVTIPRYTGEPKKQAVHKVGKDIEKAEDLLREMSIEAKNAPPSYQAQLNSKCNKYRADIQRLKKDLSATNAGTFVADRQALLGAGGYDEPGASGDTRTLLLDNHERLQRTTDRLANTRRVAEESEQIGTNVLTDLHGQREQIVRIGGRVQSMDANLGKSKSILTSMGRRIVSSKLILFCTIILLIGILGLVVYFKLKK